jgi:hypothetical protein
MAIKSAYREKPAVETPAPNIPAPSEKLHVELIDKTDPDKGTVAAIDTAIPTDEATLALQKQLADLRKSEELQRQYAMHQHAVQMSQRAQPQTRVQFLQSQGLTKTEAEWFDSREDIMSSMSNQQLASEAAAEALAAGIERDSPEFFEAVEEGFAKRVEALNQQPAAQPAAFSQPRSVSPSPAAPPDRSSLYAAPVSRTAPSGGYREPSAKSVRLSPIEQEIARGLKISDVEYAQGKLRLAREKATGERQQ